MKQDEIKIEEIEIINGGHNYNDFFNIYKAYYSVFACMLLLSQGVNLFWVVPKCCSSFKAFTLLLHFFFAFIVAKVDIPFSCATSGSFKLLNCRPVIHE